MAEDFKHCDDYIDDETQPNAPQSAGCWKKSATGCEPHTDHGTSEPTPVSILPSALSAAMFLFAS